MVQDDSCYGDADAVGELAALYVKGKPERVAPRLYAHERIKKLLEISVSVITWQNTDVVHTELQRIQKQISLTEFVTLLCLIAKRAFMNGNKRVVTRSFTAV